MDGKNAKDGGINRRNLLLSAGAIGAGVAAATLSQASPALANGSFFGDNCIIYPAGLFTGSQQANRFPARSRPRLTSINGNAAGHHDVTGLKVADDLAGVLWLKRDSSAANIDIVDLTGEFSITADGRITNTTTDTSGDRLLVSYSTSPGTQLAGLPFPPGETSKGTLPLLAPAAWESVKVSILGLSGEQTVSHEGTVRLGWQSNGAGAATAHTYVDVELDNKIYLGELPFPTSPSPAPLPWYKPMPAGVLEDFQFVQLSLHRFGGDEADTLVYPFCVVFVILTEG